MFSSWKSVERLELPDINYEVKVITTLFLFSIAAGLLTANNPPDVIAQIIDQLSAIFETIDPNDSLEVFTFILTNNLTAVLTVIVAGILFGISPMMSSILNGYIIGVVSGLAILESQASLLFIGLIPHGIIEVPALVIALAIGLHLGRDFWHTLNKVKLKSALLTRSDKITWWQKYLILLSDVINLTSRKLISALKLVWYLLVPLIVMAALIESTVTPYLLELALK